MLDDDRPDYFLSDEEPDENVSGKNVIDFQPATGNGSANGNAEEKNSRHRLRKAMIWTGVIGVAILAAAFYLRYCSAYAVDAIMRVYIVNVEKRGLVFKTYEAQVVAIDALADTTKVYSHPEQFTIADESLAHRLQEFQGQRIPVTLHYEKFYATLPWRGASKWVVTSISTNQ